MDARAVWDIGIGAGSVTGSGLLNWSIIAYKLGKRDGRQVQQVRTLTEALAKSEGDRGKERERHANQFLRIFQSIEQLRRLHKTGNGGVNWTDLAGEA